MREAEAVVIETIDAGHEDVLAAIDAGLHDFNERSARLDQVRPLVCVAKLPDGRLIGGVRARTWGRNCEIQQLWVADEFRCHGIGRRLMAASEIEARRRGCSLIYLESFNFQAPAFYQRLGFEVIAEIGGFPDGISKTTLRKILSE